MNIKYHCETHTYYRRYHNIISRRQREDALLGHLQDSAEYQNVKNELEAKRTMEDVWIQLENSLNDVGYDSDSDDTDETAQLYQLCNYLRVKDFGFDVNVNEIEGIKKELVRLSSREEIKKRRQLHHEIKMCIDELDKISNV